ncbi:phenol 2-monooxygenase [Aureobasidium pullulans]|nr:phenol 2-monooxygenase [Aureobasidium pullulans]
MPGTDVLESKVDVLMAASWMARCGVTTRIVDKRGSEMLVGQADGLQPRSLEIFESMGIIDRVRKESNQMMEFSIWKPGADGVLQRADRIPNTPIGISQHIGATLHQGQMERILIDDIEEQSAAHGKHFTVEQRVLATGLEVNESLVEDDNAHPIRMTLRHLTSKTGPQRSDSAHEISNGMFRSNLSSDDHARLMNDSATESREELVNARYVIGCDGAHSWTRRQLGFELEGEPTDYIWGVLDIVPITDFPDIRNRCSIHSERSGSVMIIPRRDGQVRLYVQLQEVKPNAEGRTDRSKITPEIIFAAAKGVLAPYSLDYQHCSWWTAYQIGQRVGTSFSKNERIFIAGDAVHTHSPKAGQGMNVSMQDSYNLGWKIAQCVLGKAPRSILKTYQLERRRVAQDLIDFDHKLSRFFSGRPAKDVSDATGVSMDEFKQLFVKGALFACGLSVNYGRSMLVDKEDVSRTNDNGVVSKAHVRPGLASEIPLGMRFPSYRVLNQCGARPHQVHELLKSDGRYRVILFAGNVKDDQQRTRIARWCEKADAKDGWLKRYSATASVYDSTIELLTIHSAPRVECNLLDDFPDVLHPLRLNGMGWDYEKVYVDDESYHHGHGRAYEKYGIDRIRGCVVIVRPDGYTGFVGELEDVDSLSSYFARCLLPLL